MGRSGWMGRLRLAARAIDLRLKAVPRHVFQHTSCALPCSWLPFLKADLAIWTYPKPHG